MLNYYDIEQEANEQQQKEELAWKRQVEYLSPLMWEWDGLFIRPAYNRAELKAEGKILHHCVYCFASKAESGQTHIFFIRRKTAPDTPYFTLELSSIGKIIRCNGHKNDIELLRGTRPQQIKDFETMWLEEIVKPFFKKR